jgi:chromatin assembly factor 1 subunit A
MKGVSCVIPQKQLFKGFASDKTLSALSKYVRQQILPAQDEDESGAAALASAALPLPTVESAILSILTRRNYGLEAPVEDVKIPSSLCVWRWEIKEEYLDWLPKAAKGKAEARIAERLQVRSLI